MLGKLERLALFILERVVSQNLLFYFFNQNIFFMKQRFSFSWLTFCLFYCFFFDSFRVSSQNFGCIYKWRPSYSIAAETVRSTIPNGFFEPPFLGNIFYSGKNTSLPLTFRFGDIDERKAKGKQCGDDESGWILKQHEPENYRMTFSSNSANVTFGGQPTITVDCIKLRIESNTALGFTFSVMENSPVSVTIDNDWTGLDIEISVKIEDNAGIFEARDPDYKLTPWKIRKVPTACPTKLVLNSANPTSVQWGTWVVVSQPQLCTLEYEASPDIGTPGLGDYISQAIVEKFTGPFATDIFTMDDINMAWSLLNQITTADGVASYLFSSANPATFILNNNDHFKDDHQMAIVAGAVKVPISGLSSVFTQDAIMNKRVGFKLDQTYVNAIGATIKNTTINRKASGEIVGENFVLNAYEFKKTH